MNSLFHSVITMLLALIIPLTPFVRTVSAGETASNAATTPSQSSFSQTSDHRSASLLASTSEGVSFEIRLRWQEIEQEIVNGAEKSYLRLSKAGWALLSQPGEPALPYLVQQIGVPPGVELELRVRPGRVRQIALSAPLIPAATIEPVFESFDPAAAGQNPPATRTAFVENPQVYTAAAAYPGELARISGDGFIRQQRVVSISLFPLQAYAQMQQITIYETLQVEVIFKGSPQRFAVKAAPEAASFEKILSQQLLNYDSARAWRQPASAATVTSFSTPELSQADAAQARPWSPPNPGWRIMIQQPGMYKLSYSELQAAGLPLASLDPRSFQLFNQGSEVAIQVVGEADQVFNENDVLLFYSEAYNTKYSRENVYWLTYGKTAQGLRMSGRDGAPGAASTPDSYQATRHLEDNKFYLTSAPGDDDFERFFWDYLYPPVKSTWSTSFSLAAPGSAAAILKISMLGFAANILQPDHHIRISLNGVELYDGFWDGIAWRYLEIPVPQGVLQPGANLLLATALLGSGMTFDIIYVDWAELVFTNTFTAENNVLDFSYNQSGEWKYLIDGFSGNQVSVFDVSNPKAVVRIENIATAISDLGYTAQFEDTVAESSNYWAGANTAFFSVKSIQADSPSDLAAATNGADHLVITHQAFAAQAQLLSDFRATQGLRAVSLDVQDIYDQFAYGITSPAAIHDFLAYSYTNWQPPAPAYVVLMGDAHYDPTNYLGYGRTSFLPTNLLKVDPWIGETATDNRYAMLVGEDLMPDMMLGRISVNSAAEALVFVNKIKSYELTPVSGDWQQQVLAVTDNMDGAGDFAAISDDLLDTYLPNPYTAEKVYYGLPPYTVAADTKAAVLAGFNAGKFLVNYIGHGFTTGWADEVLFATTNVPTLQNGGKQPVVLAMTCMEGFFHNPQPYANNREALGEVMTRVEGKGAIASWSPTGNGVSVGHDKLNTGFYESVFFHGNNILGEAIYSGQLKVWSSGRYLFLLDAYVLFGDPALVFARPFTAVGDAYSANQDTPLLVSSAAGVLSNDINPEGLPLSAELVETSLHGALVLQSDGSFSYTPNPGWYGEDSFTYRAYNGVTYSNPATVNITVYIANENPTDITLSAATISENMPANTQIGLFSTSDPDAGDTFSYSLVAGAGAQDNAAFVIDQNILRSGIAFDYETKPQLSIRVRTTDQRGGWYEESYLIQVLNLNEKPVAQDDSFNGLKNSVLVLTSAQLIANDSDVDTLPEDLSVIHVTNASGGDVMLDGDSITFNPTTDFTGTAGFDYYLGDGSLYDIGHVTIEVLDTVIPDYWLFLPLTLK